MKKETVYRVFSHLPTLETDRLILRRMAVTDAEDMFAYAKNEETTRYLTWYPHRDVNYTRRIPAVYRATLPCRFLLRLGAGVEAGSPHDRDLRLYLV